MLIRRKLAIIAGIYLIEGFPMGMAADVWPIYLRTHGASLSEIGRVAGLSIAWTLKFLWSPPIGRFGIYRYWIASALVAMSLALLAIGSATPQPMSGFLLTAFAIYCLASATQDIAIDAYAIGLTARGEEGPINSMKASAYRIGALLSGAALLYLPKQIGWRATFHVASALTILMFVSTLRLPAASSGNTSWPAMAYAFQRWGRRPALLTMLGFVFLYRLGDLSMGPMIKPLWVDRGYTPDRIADITVALGTLLIIAGATVGGFVMQRIGMRRALLVLGACALGSNFVYAAAAAFPQSGTLGLVTASAFESFSAGLGSMAFMSFLMRICDKEHAAVQYAFLTALASSGRILNFVSGNLAEAMGYSAYFVLTGVIALPSLVLIAQLQGWIDASEVGVEDALSDTSP